MSNIIISTSYLPPIDYIKAIVSSETVMMEHHENFQKRSYRNRAVIQSANGLLNLTVPINKTMGIHTPIDKITIDHNSTWQHDHWIALKSAYNKSPYFDYYNYLIEPLYQKKWPTLMELNEGYLECILKILSIQKTIGKTVNYESFPKEFTDLRNLHLDHKLGKTYYKIPPYPQVFDFKNPFDGRVSIFDTLFNLGPQTMVYLRDLKEV